MLQLHMAHDIERLIDRLRVALPLARRHEEAIFRLIGAVLLEEIDAIQTEPLPGITTEAA